MPTSKKVGKYGAYFFDLLNVTKERLPLVFDCETPARAKQRRLQIYGFIEALRKEGHPGVATLDGFLLRVDGPMLIIEDRDNDSFGQMIAAALAQQPIRAEALPVTPAAVEEHVHATELRSGLSEHEKALERYLQKDKS